MTRMWLVPPAFLCKNHLMGEHGEMHQAVGTIENHPHGQAVMEGHCRDVRPDDVDTSLIEERHDRLVVEMLNRGINHDSELPEFEDPEIGELDEEDLLVNADELVLKCSKCRRRRQALGSEGCMMLGYRAVALRRD